MCRSIPIPVLCVLFSILSTSVTVTPARPVETAFLEAFVLGDRGAALELLVPGSPDHLFYSALDAQFSGNHADFGRFLGELRRKSENDPRVEVLENRDLLLLFDRDPDACVQRLVEKLGLRFDHTPFAIQTAERTHPDRLPPDPIDIAGLMRKYAGENDPQAIFSREGLPVFYQTLPPKSRPREHLLETIDLDPAIPGLLDDLAAFHRDTSLIRPFGVYKVEDQLFLDQLQELARRIPQLLEDEKYIDAWLRRLRADEDPTDDERDAQLNRQLAFAQSLGPRFDTLKAALIHAKLERNLTRRLFDKRLFLQYLATSQGRPVFSEAHPLGSSERTVSPADFWPAIDVQPIHTYESLTQVYLDHFLARAKNWSDFRNYFATPYLRQAFASAKILSGDRDRRHFDMLSAPKIQELNTSVEIALPPHNPTRFKPGEAIALEVLIKNVPELLVQVYRLNARGFYMSEEREIDLDFDAHGLVPTHAYTLKYTHPVTTRHAETLTLNAIQRPGVYVVDMSGNGRRARALIRIGHLHAVSWEAVSGVVFAVLNEEKQPVAGAHITIDGHDTVTDDTGRALIPCPTKRAPRQAAVVHKDDIAVLHVFDHKPPAFKLTAAIFLEQESLLPGKRARVVISPRLWAGFTPVSVEALSHVSLDIETHSFGGRSAVEKIEIERLSNFEDLVREFVVPADLVNITFTLTGKVDVPWRDEALPLSASRVFGGVSNRDNGQIGEILFDRHRGTHRVRLLGKNGEPLVNQIVHVDLSHRLLVNPEHFTLQTDSSGIVILGKLVDIDRVGVTWNGLTQAMFPRQSVLELPVRVHLNRRDRMGIPYSSNRDFTVVDNNIALGEFRLYRQVRGVNTRNAGESLSLDAHQIVLRDLAAGDYQLLHLPTRRSTAVVVGDFARDNWLVVGAKSVLWSPPPSSLAITDVSERSGRLRIRVSGGNETTRVHLFGRRFHSPDHPSSDFRRNYAYEPLEDALTSPPARFLSNATTNDEIQYILNRRRSRLLAGNLLARPGLLLNRTEIGSLPVRPPRTPVGSLAEEVPSDGETILGASRGCLSTSLPVRVPFLEFLATPGVSRLNLVPDRNGEIEIPMAGLSHLQSLRIVALDLHAVTYADYDIDSPDPLTTRDLRLRDPFPPDQGLRQQLVCLPVRAGDTFRTGAEVPDEFVIYDELADLYQLMLTIGHAQQLADFAFVARWATLSDEEKRAKYSEYACHELNLFLYHKDPGFFHQVISPYLKNKLHKTFVDRYLLGDNLSSYRGDRFSRLNLFERILLAERDGVEPTQRSRYVRELVELKPISDVEADRLIHAALGTFELEQAGGHLDELGSLEERLRPSAVKTAVVSPKGTLHYKGGRSGEVRFLVDGVAVRGFDGPEKEGDGVFFKNVGDTKIYMENEYYRLNVRQQNADLIPPGRFWVDVASSGDVVLSPHVVEANHNFTEIMLALALTDLPFDADTHEVTTANDTLAVVFQGNALVFTKRLLRFNMPTEKQGSLLVAQRYFETDSGDAPIPRKERVRVDKEFLPGRRYVCDVTVTNPTETEREGTLLIQIPQGAIGLTCPSSTHSERVAMPPYRTASVRYSFYFPAAGAFTHTPARVSLRDEIPITSAPSQLQVAEERTSSGYHSWEDLANHGSNSEVLNFLSESNLGLLDLNRINFRLKDPDFFMSYMRLVETRHHFHQAGYGYSFLHRYVPGIRRFLRESELSTSVGRIFASRLLDIDPIEDKSYQHLEYDPLVVARAHEYPGQSAIVSPELKNQYEVFLETMAYTTPLTDSHRLQFIYYFLLQNRIEEALDLFAALDPDDISPRLQYDYLSCYMDFFLNDPEAARRTASRYADYPVDRWRLRFEEVLRQAEEAAGGSPGSGTGREARLSHLAARTEALDFDFEEDGLIVFSSNIDSFVVSLYDIDIEVLFSRNPFGKELGRRFIFVDPSHTFTVRAVPSAQGQLVDLPAGFGNRNMSVEVRSGERVVQKLHLRSELRVERQEKFGRLTVFHRESGSHLPEIYVKVYADHAGGDTYFYKDGYTDPRGVFDYASVSSDRLDMVSEFAILVLSEEFGSEVFMVAPPKE